MARKRNTQTRPAVRTPQVPLDVRVITLTDDEPSPLYLALMQRLLTRAVNSARTDEGQVAA
jgi:hypothetical protein